MARFSEDTPGRIGSARRASAARAARRRGRRARSRTPAARAAGTRSRGAGPALRVEREQRRSPVRIVRERATGSAKCSPAEPRSASACHGSCTPVVITPAAPAAAATRTQAPRLPRCRGSSSRTTGAGPGSGQDPVGVRAAAGAARPRRPAPAGPRRPARRGRRRSATARRRARAAPQRRELLGVGGPDAEQLAAEAHRVLDGVETLEDHQPGSRRARCTSPRSTTAADATNARRVCA